MPPVISPPPGNPYNNANFQLVVDGISDNGSAVSAGFTDIGGLVIEMKPIEYRNGNEDFTNRKMPGLKTYLNIVCKRGVTGHTEFWRWYKRALDGDVLRADGAIILISQATASEVMRWKFKNGWPCKYTTPPLLAATAPGAIAIETFEICIEKLEIDL